MELTIRFYGICAHFRDAVPGVPHRVVLPKAVELRPGVLEMPGSPTQEYLLNPHFGLAFMDDKPLELPELDIVGGLLAKGVRMQVVNAIDPELVYPQTPYDPDERPFGTVPRLPELVPSFRYSDDVVLGGRAACYFDVFRGSITAFLNGKALCTVIRMQTDGPPRLQVTPLRHQPLERVQCHEVTLGPSFAVANVAAPDIFDAQYDFLWHLVTAESNIPVQLKAKPPGLDGPSEPALTETMTDRFTKLLARGYPGRVDIDPADAAAHETSPSCSNSQWP